MKPRPPPNQIVPAETTHYYEPCFHSIGGVWWETKLWLVKFFVVLFEGTSESPTNQTDRGVDTSDCFPQLVITIIMWVRLPRSNVRLSTKNQKNVYIISAGHSILRNFFIFPLDKCRKVCYNQRAQDGSQGPNFRPHNPHMQNFCYFQQVYMIRKNPETRPHMALLSNQRPARGPDTPNFKATATIRIFCAYGFNLNVK